MVVLLNLLIALINTEYDDVKQSAKEEAAFLKAQICYDLQSQQRLLPVPFNWFPLIISVVIHILNFVPALISPDYLNIYAYLVFLNPMRSKWFYMGYLHPTVYIHFKL